MRLVVNLFILALAVPVSLLGGFVSTQLWGWFVVPLGIGPISLWHACGLLTFVALLQTGLKRRVEGGSDDGVEEDVANGITRLFEGVVTYLIVWGFAAIYHALMAAQ